MNDIRASRSATLCFSIPPRSSQEAASVVWVVILIEGMSMLIKCLSVGLVTDADVLTASHSPSVWMFSRRRLIRLAVPLTSMVRNIGMVTFPSSGTKALKSESVIGASSIFRLRGICFISLPRVLRSLKCREMSAGSMRVPGSSIFRRFAVMLRLSICTSAVRLLR